MDEYRSAIKPHSTSVVDEAWDGPANIRRLKLDADSAYYKKMYAWQDPEYPSDEKAAYKFPHHEVSNNGDIGPANARACIAIIASLNGARGGADIPDEDRKGVYNHAARHLIDDKREPAELASRLPQVEYRAVPDAQNMTAEGNCICGYAAVFGEMSLPMGSFRECIEPGAFRESVENDDIRALYNHDTNYVLGRTTNGTLALREDPHGLYYEITPPETTWARDLMESIRRGDITQSSFGFRVLADEWEGDTRRLMKVALYDVSPVTFPAYPQTDVSIRSIEAEEEMPTVKDHKGDAAKLRRRKLGLYT